MSALRRPAPGRRPQDAHGIPLSGANAAAATAYERALAASRNWRVDAGAQLEHALRESPRFVMAHALRAYLLVCGRDPRGYRAARPVLDAAQQWPADRYERLHLAAIGAALDDDLARMRACLDELLHARPHDLLALQVAQSIDYMTGDFVRMAMCADATLRRLPAALPGYGPALAMHAFALVENGDAGRAEQGALHALALDPLNARAHHAMAHVFEMSDRPEDGLRWMEAHHAAWSCGTTFTTHGWWHTALFHLARQDIGAALAVYDRRICGPRAPALSDLIDAVSLLWRIRLQGHAVGARAAQLAAAWEPHADDRSCTFADVHAMLAFGLAGDGARAERLEATLVRSAARPTRHGATTRGLGLPAVRALRAFVRGDMMVAIPLLASLPPIAHRLGGSHAQRDVLHLTLLAAIEGVRRPGRSHALRAPSAAVRPRAATLA
ncbi:tetratricopeptide repeat protein [Pseudorhodoferax sp.]|uniref:tetratricopeptide repeat protein n=1 Tax=Pseudorhodoferax sp. TaxID=1993553 RepID=UPI002DD6414C|nr:tetratricopeptide repeat protein [Pseudorhodoferax sp.]